MKNPQVSVICTNFNKGEWIRTAIESFLRQKTNFDFEILIIDDCSTDNSPQIIQELAEENPQIRVFKNEKNLGITKTWIKICKEAKGKYIARCDGDDYWCDDLKLQKQFDILEKTGAKWCNSDFRMINERDEILAERTFESGKIKMPTNFTQMLVSKGFTSASTWLVETKLMQEINDLIDENTSDDTFNIQLELFMKTKLEFLPDITEVYRVNEGSDSHIQDIEKMKNRLNNLEKTQLKYFEKYREKIDIEILAKESFEIVKKMEISCIEMNQTIKNQNNSIDSLRKELEYLLKIIKFSPILRIYLKLRSLKGGKK